MKLNKSRIVGSVWAAISAATLGAYLYLCGRNDEKADVQYESRTNDEIPSPEVEEETLGADTH